MLKKLICTVLIVYHPLLYGKTLLWDLGGVLCNPDKLGVAQTIGLSNFLSYTLFDAKSPNIESLLFDVLSYVEQPKRGCLSFAGTAEGKPLPFIMCKWQAGLIDGPDVIKKAEQKIKELDAFDYFESKREKNLIKRSIRAIFTPHILARNIYPLERGFRLLEECARVKNKDGTKKNRNFVFSNQDRLSWNIFYRENRVCFRAFNEIVISGLIGHIKPDPSAYEYLLKTYNLDPKECILIDDQKINTDAARKFGIKTILIDNENYDEVRRKLVQLGAL